VKFIPLEPKSEFENRLESRPAAGGTEARENRLKPYLFSRGS
jgi:hypothetical protein